MGMGKDLCERFESAKRVFQRADEVLDTKLTALMWEGPERLLRNTQNAQPALLTASVAALTVLEERGLRPDLAAGHSLGEYSALVCAKVLEFETALKVVRERGRLMEEAGRKTPGAMAAIIGLPAEDVQNLCREVQSMGPCEAVNFNASDQIVIAGTRPAVEKALVIAKEKGAKRAVPLNVSGAFHSSLMSEAARKMGEVLEEIPFRDARCPVVSNCDARMTSMGSLLKSNLVTQIDHPVLWEQSVKTLLEAGADPFIEVGPGRVLTALGKRIDRSAHSLCTEDDSTFDKILTEVNSCGSTEK